MHDKVAVKSTQMTILLLTTIAYFRVHITMVVMSLIDADKVTQVR